MWKDAAFLGSMRITDPITADIPMDIPAAHIIAAGGITTNVTHFMGHAGNLLTGWDDYED